MENTEDKIKTKTEEAGFCPESLLYTVFGENAEGIGVTWTTPDDRGGCVEYTDADDPEFLCARRAEAEVSDGVDGYRNSAVIPAAELGELSLIRLARGEEHTAAEPFRPITQDAKNGADLSFLVMTDSQNDEELDGRRWRPAFAHAFSHYPEAQFIVHGGDFVQQSGIGTQWADMIRDNAEYLHYLPLLPATGNHENWDWATNGYTETFFKHFTLSYPPQDTLYGIYYSVNIGLVHFTVLNSGESAGFGEQRVLSPEQEEWMIADLKAAKAPWKIVVIHNPFYSPGKYGSRYNRLALDLRKRYCAFFAEVGVDLVLSGHDHIYSRTYPVTGDGVIRSGVRMLGDESDRTFVDPEGPVYVVGCCCGNQYRGIECDFEEDLRYFEHITSQKSGEVGYFGVRVSRDRLVLTNHVIRFRDGEETKTEKFTLLKNR